MAAARMSPRRGLVLFDDSIASVGNSDGNKGLVTAPKAARSPSASWSVGRASGYDLTVY